MLSSAASTQRTFERVYREHFEFVWRTLRALGVRESALDDALQDVFIVVHRRLPEFQGRASVRTWTYEIARRVALRYRSRAARDAARHTELPPLVTHDDLDDALDQAMAADVMKKFLWELDEDRRQAFVLSEFGELPGREIAETLDVNMNTIYARIRSARTELDRLAKRMHAHDAGAVRRALRSRRPDPRAKGRAWAGVMAAAGQASMGHVAPMLGMGTVAWICGGVVAIGAAVSFAWTDDPPSAPPVARSEPVPAVTVAARPPAPLVAPRPVPPSVDAPPAVRPPTAAVAPTRKPTTAGPPSLREELAQVRVIRAALERGEYRDAAAHIATYRKTFTHGSLGTDVDALEVELACKTHAPRARAALDAYLSAHPSSALRTRLENACMRKIAPQTPSTDGTHPG